MPAEGHECGGLCHGADSESCPPHRSGSLGNWGSLLMICCTCCLAYLNLALLSFTSDGTNSLQSPTVSSSVLLVYSLYNVSQFHAPN